MLRKTIGQKIKRIGDAIQQPHLLRVHLKGIEVRMYESLNKPWLLNAGIRTIFDIGANRGQFARAIHEVLPEAQIYSFEPLQDCFLELQKTMANVPNFQGFNVALSDTSGASLFYRSNWSPSSSLLKMAALHKQNFPFSDGEVTSMVQVHTLDTFVEDLSIENEILVKMDVQGSEDKVIAGGESLLRRTKVLIIETSMEVLYEAQPLFSDIFKSLDERGFCYKGAISQLCSPRDGSVLQANSVFVRNT